MLEIRLMFVYELHVTASVAIAVKFGSYLRGVQSIKDLESKLSLLSHLTTA